jgi:hypothetical protein
MVCCAADDFMTPDSIEQGLLDGNMKKHKIFPLFRQKPIPVVVSSPENCFISLEVNELDGDLAGLHDCLLCCFKG